jgi:hypothetical protein
LQANRIVIDQSQPCMIARCGLRILIASIVGLLAGILVTVIGVVLAQAFMSGAVAFGTAVPLVLAIQRTIVG